MRGEDGIQPMQQSHAVPRKSDVNVEEGQGASEPRISGTRTVNLHNVVARLAVEQSPRMDPVLGAWGGARQDEAVPPEDLRVELEQRWGARPANLVFVELGAVCQQLRMVVVQPNADTRYKVDCIRGQPCGRHERWWNENTMEQEAVRLELEHQTKHTWKALDVWQHP